MAGRTPAGIEVESSVDVEPTHLLLEVFVHNGSRGRIREVTIRPEVRRGDLVPEAVAKAIAGLSAGRSGRAAFLLRPRGRAPEAAEIAAAVTYVDARGARHRLTAPRVSLDLALPRLRPTAIPSDAFEDRASRAFLHTFELSAHAPPGAAIRSAAAALATLSLARIDEAVSSAEPATARVSLFGLDARGTGYMVRIVAVPRDGVSIVRVSVFVESETGLFAFHHRVREALESALASR